MPTPIGRAIRRVRTARNMTQKSLAEATGLSKTHISTVESGGRGISWEALQRVAYALNVNVSLLAMLTEADDSAISPYLPIIYTTIYEGKSRA